MSLHKQLWQSQLWRVPLETSPLRRVLWESRPCNLLHSLPHRSQLAGHRRRAAPETSRLRRLALELWESRLRSILAKLLESSLLHSLLFQPSVSLHQLWSLHRHCRRVALETSQPRRVAPELRESWLRSPLARLLDSSLLHSPLARLLECMILLRRSQLWILLASQIRTPS